MFSPIHPHTSLIWQTKQLSHQIKKNFHSKLVTQDLDDDGVYHIETKQDVTNVINNVKMLSETTTPGKDLRHVAEIPMVVAEQAMREGWFNDKAKMKAWLNNSDNSIFRIWKGKV